MGLVLLCWRIGRRIDEYGHSFGVSNLRHMLRFAEAFPEEQIAYALSRQSAVIEGEIKILEVDIVQMLGEVTT